MNVPFTVPPVVKTLVVARRVDDAFALYTREFGTWWPRATHSLGQEKVADILLECREGGRIFERWADGTEKLWGTVSVFDPPRRIVHTWHVSTDPAHASEVELRFDPVGANRTRVTLEHRHWERMSGAQAQETRDNYDKGWEGVLLGSFGAHAGRVEGA
jgi:hypothetical protein